jgi:SAM-dependent methyltransferase
MLGIVKRILGAWKTIIKKTDDFQGFVQFPENCPVCGASSFKRNAILWDSLVKEWKLTPQQRNYVDDQQGLSCDSCTSNLRSMTLASAILSRFKTTDTFADYCTSDTKFRDLRVLEINEAGTLTSYLRKLPKHFLAAYPEYDMQHLGFPDSSFDLVIHSDTLEHIPNSVIALQECRRVLAPKGFLAYTIPIIPDRLTRSRKGLSPSYHGNEVDKHLVYREYGGDFWHELFEAGFRNVHIHNIIYPASMAVIAE